MSESRRQRVLEALRFYENYGPASDSESLMRAICHTCLDDYPKALSHYRTALQKALGQRPLWVISAQPDWLVHIYVMAERPGSYARARAVYELHKSKSPWRDGLSGRYCEAVWRLIEGKDEEARGFVPELLARPKYKDILAMGKTIAAIADRNQADLDGALDLLLAAHRGQAKFGALRETAEGFLCLPAMSLARMALDRAMTVNTDSEYMSMGYLAYILENGPE